MKIFQLLVYLLPFISSQNLAESADPTASSDTTATEATTAAARETHNIAVGAQGHSFTPSFVQAAPGDVISFRFYPLNHSIARAAFGQPCIPYEYTGINHVGFWSGFKPVAVVLSDPPVYNLVVNDTEPIFFYCSSPGACQDGMVGAINPNATQTFEMQHDEALKASLALSPGEYFEPELAPSGTMTSSNPSGTSSTSTSTSNTASSSNSKHSLSTGSIIGISIGAVLGLLVAGLLFYMCGRQRSMREYIANHTQRHGHAHGERQHSIQEVRYPNKEYEGPTVEEHSPTGPVGQAMSLYTHHSPYSPAEGDPPSYPGESPTVLASSRQNAFTDVHPAYHDFPASSPPPVVAVEDARQELHELDDSSPQHANEQRPFSFTPGHGGYVQRGYGDEKTG